ncbi:hypothetical protein PAP_02130 [Palaeococcus pacificus DY20341]|uniref:NADH:quinone oxidoreductase/Mrp antiporter transmembrane domain-containing protein n=1 Tax=Palaeococcus pacificus DY20341 TaxID=1343739 RepID=A0A075LWF7_9EURY|nr:proton-conducting transporter membrane subunit [Palaeococcus pacificus]AIF68858.1 hypothetical protein PAP_02130 [Palaeococcus pacificus DY20341]
MIPLIVAFPLLFAFVVSLIPALRLQRKLNKPAFLIGIFTPWLFFVVSAKEMPISEIVGQWSRVSGIEVALDAYNFYFILAELILFSLVSLYSLSYFEHRDINKIYSLILLMHAGLLGAFISRDLFNYYIYLEIASVAAFALVGLSSEKGAKRAAYKYLMFSLIASYFFIFAVGIIYLKTGYLNVTLIKDIATPSKEISAALGVAFTALLLKAGIFPLHFWLPDAHSKAPTPISALLSGIVVKAPIYGMLLLALTFPLNHALKTMLFVIAFFSMFFGIVMALLQKNAKKLLAYHTVSQMGYILLGMATLNFHGAIYHAFAHALFKGGLFLSVGTIVTAQKTKDLDKLSYRGDKVLMLSILMLSLAIGGISPFIGAFSKKELLVGLSRSWAYLFQAAGIGTLISFMKLNYYMMKPGEVWSTLPRRMVSFAMAILTLAFGLYFGMSLALKEDFVAIIGALVVFISLKKLGVFELQLKPKFEENMKGLGVEVNFYSALFAFFLVLFLL